MNSQSWPAGTSDQVWTSPHYPEYVSYHKRLGTFGILGLEETRKIGCFTVDELAEDGFFVSDLITNTKALFCFHCNLFVSERTLRSAESSKELEDLHNLRCEYVRERSRLYKVPKVVPRRRHLLSAANLAALDGRTTDVRPASRSHLGPSSSKMNASMAFGPSLDEDSDSDVFEGDDSEVLASQEVHSATKSMATYKERLASFANWPADHPQDPRSFAKYGMFYTGVEDRTQCCSCGVIIWGWEPYRGDPKAPLLAHKKFHKLYQECKFIQGRSWSNKVSRLNPVGAMINWDKATSPQMISEADRMRTFDQLPYIDQNKITAFADAGFYLMPNKQIIKCFYCGIGVELNQHDMEDPWTLHARLTMGCTFLNRRKGLLFVHRARRISTSDTTDNNESGERSVTRKYLERIVPVRLRELHRNSKLVENILSAFGGTTSNTNEAELDRSIENDGGGEAVSTVAGRPEIPQSTGPSSEITPIVRDVINMGFTARQVERALDEFSRAHPEQSPDTESLLQLILDAQDKRNRQRVRGAQRRLSEENGRIAQVQSEREIAPERFGARRSSDAESSVKICVICMEQPANVAFIPCGHVESCKKCSKALHNCHICRENIESRIRVYI